MPFPILPAIPQIRTTEPAPCLVRLELRGHHVDIVENRDGFQVVRSWVPGAAEPTTSFMDAYEGSRLMLLLQSPGAGLSDLSVWTSK